LDVSLSNSNLSRNVHVYGFNFCLVIDDRVSGDSLGVNWSLNDFSSLDWGLDDSLSDDRLAHDGLGDNRLTDDFSGDYWLGLDSLSLGDSWL